MLYSSNSDAPESMTYGFRWLPCVLASHQKTIGSCDAKFGRLHKLYHKWRPFVGYGLWDEKKFRTFSLGRRSFPLLSAIFALLHLSWWFLKTGRPLPTANKVMKAKANIREKYRLCGVCTFSNVVNDARESCANDCIRWNRMKYNHNISFNILFVIQLRSCPLLCVECLIFGV